MASIANYINISVFTILPIFLLCRGIVAQNSGGLRSKFECPPLPSTCLCSFVFSDIEIQCPIDEPKIIVRIQPTKYVQIDCMPKNEMDYSVIPTMKIGDLKTVSIQGCPFPRNQSFQNIFDIIGATQVKALFFRRSTGNTLFRQHFTGLGNLTRLNLDNNGLTDLPADLFTDLGNLNWLELKSNRLHLPRDIFASLDKLDFLELGSNQMQSLDEGLFRNQKLLKHLNLWGNSIQNLKKRTFEALTSIVDLDLSGNKLKSLDPDVFHLLSNLTELNLGGNNFTSLPEGLFTENKKLYKLRILENRERMETLPSALLSNLPVLNEVQIRCYLTSVPDNLFSGSVQIRIIILSGNELSSLPGTLLANQSKLEQLDLSRNRLLELDDDLFANTKSLRVLRLSYNKLVNISSNLFNDLVNLTELYIDNNNLHHIDRDTFRGTKSIQLIDLKNNYLTLRDGGSEDDGIEDDRIEVDGNKFDLNDLRQMTDFANIPSPFQNLVELKTLILRNNSINTIFQDWMFAAIKLEHLDLSYNKFTKISCNDFQFLSKKIAVNLSHNAIDVINFDEIFILTSVKEVTIYLEHNPILCSCGILAFVQYMQGHVGQAMQKSLHIITEELKCSGPADLSGQYVAKVRPRELYCDLDSKASSAKRCPEDCQCSIRAVDRTLIVNCSNAGLTEVPSLPQVSYVLYIELHIENNSISRLPQADHPGYENVTEIYASNNNITQFTVDNIASNLTVLDLSNNNLGWINQSVFEAFNRTTRLRKLSLGHNPWQCDCNSLHMLSFVLNNYKKIQDLNTVQCISGDKLSTLTPNDLCEEDQVVLIVACIVIALLGLFIGIAASLYYRYKNEVKVWLFAHNMCLWFVTEEELDKDKKYDAFVSYSHKDEDFITEHLVPHLESGPTPFKICLHIRDWVVGEFIPNQIVKSVEDSRRTIVVLSPNFLESIWGRMEFRAAHSAALQEGRARVIVIIYGDIGDTELLDPELKAYLNMNTYVRWDDPWFWDKLRYAMPHPSSNYERTKGLIKTALKSSTDDKLELIKPVPVIPPLTTPPAEQAGKNPLVSKLNGGEIVQNGKMTNGLNGHINGAFIINTNAKQSDV